MISQNEESMPDVSSENWLAGSFTYSINDKWKIGFQEQVRFKYTTNPLDRILTQIELENSSKNKNTKKKGGCQVGARSQGRRHSDKRENNCEKHV